MKRKRIKYVANIDFGYRSITPEFKQTMQQCRIHC